MLPAAFNLIRAAWSGASTLTAGMSRGAIRSFHHTRKAGTLTASIGAAGHGVKNGANVAWRAMGPAKRQALQGAATFGTLGATAGALASSSGDAPMDPYMNSYMGGGFA